PKLQEVIIGMVISKDVMLGDPASGLGFPANFSMNPSPLLPCVGLSPHTREEARAISIEIAFLFSILTFIRRLNSIVRSHSIQSPFPLNCGIRQMLFNQASSSRLASSSHTGLLDDMRQFMSQQAPTSGGVWCVLACAERDVVTHGESLRIN